MCDEITYPFPNFKDALKFRDMISSHGYEVMMLCFWFCLLFYERGQHCYTTLNISYELFPMSKSCPGNVRGSIYAFKQLQWRDNERDGVSNHQRFDCLINRLFRRRSKKTLKLWVTVLCEENPPVTSKTKNVFIWSLIIANDLYNVINP